MPGMRLLFFFFAVLLWVQCTRHKPGEAFAQQALVQKDPHKSLELIEKAISLKPRVFHWWAHKATYQARTGDFEGALVSIKKAKDLHTKKVAEYEDAEGLFLLALGKRQLSIDQFKIAQDLYSQRITSGEKLENNHFARGLSSRP